MDHISKPNQDNKNGNRKTRVKKQKIISADCVSNIKPKNQSKRSMSKASKAEKLLSIENCDLGNNINNPPCSRATKSDNVAPSTAKSEPDAFHLVRKSKSKKLQGLPLEKAEALRVKANQQERERQRAINQAFDQLRMLDMPYNAKLAEDHKEESKIYVVKNAADYIRDLMAILEESNRRFYAGNLPMTAYTSSGAYLNQLPNPSTIGLTSLESQFPSLLNNGMASVGNHFPTSNNGMTSVGNHFPTSNNGMASVGNHFPTPSNVGLEYVENQFPSLTAAMGSVVHHFPSSATVAMDSLGNHCPRSASVGMGFVANLPPSSSHGGLGSVGPRPYRPLRNLTNLQHPYQFPGHLHQSFCSSSSNHNYISQTPGLMRPQTSSGVVTGQTTRLMQPPTPASVATMSTTLRPTETLSSTRCSQVLYGDITPKAGTLCDQVSGNTSNSMLSLPHCSPITQAHTSPMMSYQGLSNSTQPYTSTPVSGNRFKQWPNPQADFLPRANSHTGLNSTPNHSHNQIADLHKVFIGCPNLLMSSNQNCNDSGYLEMSNISSRRSTDCNLTFASDFITDYCNNSSQSDSQRKSQDSTQVRGQRKRQIKKSSSQNSSQTRKRTSQHSSQDSGQTKKRNSQDSVTESNCVLSKDFKGYSCNNNSQDNYPSSIHDICHGSSCNENNPGHSNHLSGNYNNGTGHYNSLSGNFNNNDLSGHCNNEWIGHNSNVIDGQFDNNLMAQYMGGQPSYLNIAHFSDSLMNANGVQSNLNHEYSQ